MRFAEKVLVPTLLSVFVLESTGVEKQPPRLAWTDVQRTTAEVGAELLRSLFSEVDASDKLGELKKRVAGLEGQLSLHSSTAGSISDYEFIQQAVAGMRSILTAPCSELESLEERIDALRKSEELLENDIPAVSRVLAKKGRRRLKRELMIMDSLRAPRQSEIEVAAWAMWVNTELFLTKGQPVTLRAGGWAYTIDLSGAGGSGPDGQAHRCAGGCLYPGGYFGQLIARVGKGGKVFFVGSHSAFHSQSNGFLHLAVNDCCDWRDNSGSFKVLVILE